MIFISTKEAAERWAIDVRLVQKQCAEGRISGVVKFQNSWMIPIDAKRPDDLRKKNSIYKKEDNIRLDLFMPFLATPMVAGSAERIIYNQDDYYYNRLYEAELRIYQGDTKYIKQCFEDFSDINIVPLQIGMIRMFFEASLFNNGVEDWRWIHKRMNTILTNIDNKKRYECIFNLLYADIALMVLQKIKNNYTENIVMGDFSSVPQPLKQYAYILYIKLLYSKRCYKEAIGAAIGFIEYSHNNKYLIMEIYMHLLLAANYIMTSKFDLSCKHIGIATELALQDNLVYMFLDVCPLLCGLDNEVIKNISPEFHKLIQTKKGIFRKNRMDIYNNHFLEENMLSYDLTEREAAILMFAKEDLSNKYISQALGISVNTVKYHMANILMKFGFSSRKELVSRIR